MLLKAGRCNDDENYFNCDNNNYNGEVDHDDDDHNKILLRIFRALLFDNNSRNGEGNSGDIYV